MQIAVSSWGVFIGLTLGGCQLMIDSQRYVGQDGGQDASRDSGQDAAVGECNDDRGCPAAMFCEFEDGVCGPPGRCVLQPEAECPVGQPGSVCGCRGEYASHCERRVNRDSAAACPSGQCGDTKQCPPGTFCQKFDRCNEPGYCEVIPDDCSYDPAFNPVCGCDDRTYENGCVANQMGASVRAGGPCDVAQPCEYFGPDPDNTQCPSDEYCATSQECAGDGVCVPRPRSELECVGEQYQLVCDCLFNAQSNCQRRLAGIPFSGWPVDGEICSGIR